MDRDLGPLFNLNGGQVADAQFPEKLQCLFQPKRYKVLYGGRGGAKSWGIARALLLLAVQKKVRVLCAREFQNSIKESVHKLLCDQIESMGLAAHFDIQRDSIMCPGTGSGFFFEGLHRNSQKIKSYEGIDILWVEEAANVSDASWEMVIPTIRAPGSEIWISFNPDKETDPTYKRFVLNPPDNAIVVQMNWNDNPWIPAELIAEKDALKLSDYGAYLNVWEGHCKVIESGAVYVDELRTATAEGRITKVPYDRAVGVSCVFDLGWSDSTAIWFVQKVGFELRLVRFYQNNRKSLDHYLEYIQKQGYIIDTLWMPFDADRGQLSTKMSIAELARAKGFKVRIVPKLTLVNGINAVRTTFPAFYFDKEACADGLQALYRYQYTVVDEGNGRLSREPLHDDSSHAADALRYLAIAMKQPTGALSAMAARVRQGLSDATDEFAHLRRFGGAPNSTTGWMR